MHDNKLKKLARNLRSDMTEAEHLLWSRLRRKQINDLQFYRQKVIGDYIVDFYCHKAKIVIEIDGSQHTESENIEKDRVRDKYLVEQGLTVLRYFNNEVLKNINLVVEDIYNKIIGSS